MEVKVKRIRDIDKVQYVDVYNKTDIYCPNCGKQTVWAILNQDDYYLGIIGICISCCKCHYNSGNFHSLDKDDILAAAVIKLTLESQIF